MADPIEVHYTPDGDDWAVAVKGRGQTLTGRAPGLIAARDRADQLVEKIAPDEPGHKTVVHLLNGDAVEFTTAYLTARLAKTEPEKPVDVPAPEDTAEQAEPAEPEKPKEPQEPQKPTPAPRAGSEADKPAQKPAEPQQEAPANSGS
jgi:outer membrane biosynthesis protein TonB